MEELILIGAGGHAKDVCDAARAQGRSVVGFVDDDRTLWGTEVVGLPVLGGFEWLSGRSAVAIIAVGAPDAKQRIDARLRDAGVRIAPAVVHPAATISPRALVEDGAVILAGAIVQPDARVRRHAFVHTASSISHDVVVEPYASLHPGVQIGGEATLEEGCFIGMAAAILPRIRIGSWTTVGAGAVVIVDLPSRVTAVGVPARVIRGHDPASERSR